MAQHFNAQEIEQKWQDYWKEHNTYGVPNEVPGKENYYVLSEFSYPSGNLHVGHWYAFALPDMYARFKRMQGYNVLYPTGFDAFGLPAENAAIKRGEDPKAWTWEHMKHMRTQLSTMGASFDWSREVVTADPDYYRWTQWMFNKFYEAGLVYRDVTKVNWCPQDQTILANEQVVGGACERCGSEVTQKDMPQWMLKITDFADDLVDDLNTLSWSEAIKQSQREWIGRKEGSLIPFTIQDKVVEVFTTRADTLFGVTYVVLAPEHSLVRELKDQIENWNEVEAYLNEVAKKSDLDRQQSTEKTGVQLKGITAINPANGEAVPVWVADYVLAHFGTGAVMAVPAHDERDFEFAQKFGLPKRVVVQPKNDDEGHWKMIVRAMKGKWNPTESKETSEENFVNFISDLRKGMFCFDGTGELVDSGEFTGLSSEEARTAIAEAVGGKLTKTYRLRDWGISRQRYWGCPIPMVYDPEGNPHAVPDEHLPWLLPTDVDHTPDGTAPLARSEELKKRTEEIFGEGWMPEVDTMDTFVDSSWYFYRYLDPHNQEAFASQAAMESWMPVHAYFGGAEHTTMHLLYSRFWVKALHRLGLVNENEPYQERYNRGLILGPDGQKMSKSKGNVIDPDEVVRQVGADTVRSYLAFIGPFNEPGNYPWDPNGVVGIRRFLDRVHRLREKVSQEASSPEFLRALHQTIKKVTEDIGRLKYNTAISAMMVLVNVAEKEKEIRREDYESLLKLLAPFAPHITEELWFELGNTKSIHLHLWPDFDDVLVVEDVVTVAVQVNGKVRATLELATDEPEEQVKEKVLANPDVLKWIEGKELKKVIYVPGKIVNIVV